MESKVGGIARYTIGDQPKIGDRRLHLNEFRFPHHPDVMKAAANIASSERMLIEYTNGPTPSLVAAISKYVDVPDKNVFVAAGSDEILRAITLMCARRGITDAIGGVPTYTHFIHFVAQAGLKWHPVVMGLSSLPGGRIDLIQLHEDLLKGGALVYLVSPNNPTGDTWDPIVVSAWAKRYPKSVFLVDEAYTEFEGVSRDEATNNHIITSVETKECHDRTPTGILNFASMAKLTAGAESLPNVVIARTFSKAFGLAGLRIGYGIATQLFADEISAFTNSKAVTAMASACAEACLGTDALAHYYKCAVVSEGQRMRLLRALSNLGWFVEFAGANFVLVYVGDAGAVTLTLKEAGIYVRDRTELPELDGFIRITSGTPQDVDAVVAALSKIKIPLAPIQKFYMDKSCIARLRKYLALAVPILKESGIMWWACEGTLLGAMRHGGIIPWDNDIDLGYELIAGAPDPVAGMVEKFAAAGLTLQRNRTDAYWQIGIDLPVHSLTPVHNCIDLFPYSFDEKSGFYLNADPRFQSEGGNRAKAGLECNTRYARDELFPLQDAPFYESTLPIPAKADDVLTRALGPNWRTEAVVREAADKGLPHKFTLRDMSPA